MFFLPALNINFVGLLKLNSFMTHFIFSYFLIGISESPMLLLFMFPPSM